VQHYGVREVEKLLQLPRSTLRALVKAGFVTPSRGARRTWLFSFQDLIVLRTAQALAAANLSRTRINKSVKELCKRLPSTMPLSGLSIGAVGDRVVVREGSRQWQAESGQYLLAFEGDPDKGRSRSFLGQPSRRRRAPKTGLTAGSPSRSTTGAPPSRPMSAPSARTRHT